MFRRFLAAIGALAITSTVMFGASASPAGALTGNEKFIMGVYEDFVLRAPSTDELAWWSTYLAGSGTRSYVISDVLDSDEFKTLWPLGISQYYLGGTNSQLGTVTSNLISTGDFVASEVAILSGSTYFSQNGSSNTGYVTAIYQDVLLRNGSSPDITYWSGQITNGTRTRSWVANYFIRTTESANRRVGGASGLTSCPSIALTDVAGISAGTYCIVLDRLAVSSEVTYWAGQLSGTSQLPSLWTSIAASTEYYNNAQSRF